MDARGFALITVLWLVAALSVLVTVGVAEAELSIVTSENRLLERRAWWAARGCLAIAQGRLTDQRPRIQRSRGGAPDFEVDHTDLGSGTWCSAAREPVDLRIHLDHVDSLGLVRATGDQRLTAAVLDWLDADDEQREGGAEADWYLSHGRPPPTNGRVSSVAELRHIRGFEGASEELLSALFTIHGDGRVDPNRAPVDVLRSLSMLPEGAADRVARARAAGATFANAEELANHAGGGLSGSAFRRLEARTVFGSNQHILRLTGLAGSGDRHMERRFWAHVTLLPGRMAIRRVETGL